MKEEKLFAALGGIDEKYLDEAARYGTRKKRPRLARVLIAAAVVAALTVTAGAVAYTRWDAAREDAVLGAADIPEYQEYQDQPAVGSDGSATLVSSLYSGNQLSVYVELSPVTQEMADACNGSLHADSQDVFTLGEWDACMNPVWNEDYTLEEQLALLDGTTNGGAMVEYDAETQTMLLNVVFNSAAFSVCDSVDLTFIWENTSPDSPNYGTLNIPISQAEALTFDAGLVFSNQFIDGSATVTTASLWASSLEVNFSLQSLEDWCDAHGGGSEAWSLIGNSYERQRAEAYGYEPATEYDETSAICFYFDSWMDSWRTILQESYVTLKDGTQVSLADGSYVGGAVPTGASWDLKFELDKALDLSQIESLTLGGETYTPN